MHILKIMVVVFPTLLLSGNIFNVGMSHEEVLCAEPSGTYLMEHSQALLASVSRHMNKKCDPEGTKKTM